MEEEVVVPAEVTEEVAPEVAVVDEVAQESLEAAGVVVPEQVAEVAPVEVAPEVVA